MPERGHILISFHLLALVPVILLSLTACKTWYKPGADEEELTKDQRRCEEETGTLGGQVFAECMKRAGWYHSDTSVAGAVSESAVPQITGIAAAPLPAQRDEGSLDKTSATGASHLGSTQMPESPKGPDEPVQRRQVGGWLQVGADAGSLQDAKAQCDAADADSKHFNDCMQDKGWRPVGIRISVEEPGDFD